ncbi:polysaccharide deacetylase family protein [Virgibacillus sediminis]|uniref:Polysaccharide deacetylase family protein n=1 Tax=Virgibacillus sediminis TaxID=202260 RepID=A0ABV7ABB1_9BACI
MGKKWAIFLSVTVLLAACGTVEETYGEHDRKSETAKNQMELKEEETQKGVIETQGDKTEESEMEKETEEKSTKPKYELNEESWSLVPLEEGVKKEVVLLTIDDAPDTYAVEMAHTLNELDAEAIFFVNGHFLDSPEEEEMLKEIHEMGFSIGNHTYNHANLTELPKSEQREEIISLNDRVEEIIGERPRFFRAPHGQNTDYSTQVAEGEDMLVMNWTYGYDYFEPYKDPEKLKTAMVSGEGPEVDIPYSLLKPGATLLMHDRKWTAEALAGIVQGLREKDYEVAKPSLVQLDE